MLVKSRRVRQRRLRPQAGCHVQPYQPTPVSAAATIRLHYPNKLAARLSPREAH
jgi:hypothetical protein